MTATHVMGLRGPSPKDHRMSLGASPHRRPADYTPRERSYPNLTHMRYWRGQDGSSCVGHGAVQKVETGRVRHGIPLPEPLSRLHAYAQGLEQQTKMGDPLRDEGTYIDRVLYAFQEVGVCAERLHPPGEKNVARRPDPEAELEGFSRAGGEFWQLDPFPGEELWLDICWTIDVFGLACVGKYIGPSYDRHTGAGVLQAPAAGEGSLGGHCTVYVEYENFGATLIEGNSWHGWGYSAGIVGSDGKTRTIQSLARVSKNWCYHRFMLNAYAWVPDGVRA